MDNKIFVIALLYNFTKWQSCEIEFSNLAFRELSFQDHR